MSVQSAPTPEPPLSPGRYLARRRVAAGLSLREMSVYLGGARPDRRATAADRLGRIERDELVGVDLDFVRRLREVFSFDEQVYLALVGVAAAPDAGLPIPAHCRRCGCSWHDPCLGHDGSGVTACAWADAAGDLCTGCAPAAPPPAAAPTPVVNANREAPRAA